MHPAVLICFVLTLLVILVSIFFGIKEDIRTGLVTFLLGCALVGGGGFGFVCSAIIWETKYEKISPGKVEVSIFERNGIVAITYNKKLYQSTDIAFLNAVKNIDYYELKSDMNAYGAELQDNLYPVEKVK